MFFKFLKDVKVNVPMMKASIKMHVHTFAGGMMAHACQAITQEVHGRQAAPCIGSPKGSQVSQCRRGHTELDACYDRRPLRHICWIAIEGRWVHDMGNAVLCHSCFYLSLRAPFGQNPAGLEEHH